MKLKLFEDYGMNLCEYYSILVSISVFWSILDIWSHYQLCSYILIFNSPVLGPDLDMGPCLQELKVPHINLLVPVMCRDMRVLDSLLGLGSKC